ncbi:MAG: hypothetical protein IJV26_02790 [Lachnospiraceae bacterium]|nr:hypothetical protein [Lachnospiraceae bacterium]
MKKALSVILSALLAGAILCSSINVLSVRADVKPAGEGEAKTGEQFLADLQDSLNCMYLYNELVPEEELTWANEDKDYSKIISSAENDVQLLYDMIADYEGAEFDDQKLTLLKDLYISGLNQMKTADRCEENDDFYMTQYTAGLITYQEAQNVLSDEYGIQILEDDYQFGNDVQDMILKFWSDYDSDGLREMVISNHTLLVPDYYMQIPDADLQTVMMYVAGDEISIAVMAMEEISAQEYDEFISSMEEEGGAVLSQELGVDLEAGYKGTEKLYEDDHSSVIRFDFEGEAEIYNGITVKNFALYIAANRESEMAAMGFVGYTGDDHFASDFDRAMLRNFGGEEQTDAAAQEAAAPEEETKPEEQPQEQDARQNLEVPEGVTPELKALLDDYEGLISDLAELVKNGDPNDGRVLMEYLSVLGKLDECQNKLDEMEAEGLSPEDKAYYEETLKRIEKKVQELDI